MQHEKVDPLIRRFQRLSHDRHFRSTQQQIAIEGIRNVISAGECCQPIVALIHCRRLLRSSVTERLIAEQRNFAVRVVNVSPEQFRSFSTARHASGIAAITSVATQRLAAVHVRNDDCWVALSEVRSAGNFGSLVRTAAALEATGFLLIGQSADPFSPDTIRASMGSFFRQQFIRTSWTEFADWRQQHNATVVGACPNSAEDAQKLIADGPVVLMLGEERRGLSSRQRKNCDRFVRIPMASSTDSLNLAVAGSILLYEARIVGHRNSDGQ